MGVDKGEEREAGGYSMVFDRLTRKLFLLKGGIMDPFFGMRFFLNIFMYAVHIRRGKEIYTFSNQRSRD